MKNLLLFSLILFVFVPRTLPAIEYAYVRDNAIVAVPVALPVVGVRADTKQVVFNLWGADNNILNVCGYYPVSRFDRATLQSNEVVTAIAWTIEKPLVVERVTIGHKINVIVLDRVKLATVARAQGWSEAMMNFINGDPVIAVRWYSNEKLVAGSEELAPFLQGFAAAVGVKIEQLMPLLELCKEDKKR